MHIAGIRETVEFMGDIKACVLHVCTIVAQEIGTCPSNWLGSGPRGWVRALSALCTRISDASELASGNHSGDESKCRLIDLVEECRSVRLLLDEVDTDDDSQSDLTFCEAASVLRTAPVGAGGGYLTFNDSAQIYKWLATGSCEEDQPGSQVEVEDEVEFDSMVLIRSFQTVPGAKRFASMMLLNPVLFVALGPGLNQAHGSVRDAIKKVLQIKHCECQEEHEMYSVNILKPQELVAAATSAYQEINLALYRGIVPGPCRVQLKACLDFGTLQLIQSMHVQHHVLEWIADSKTPMPFSWIRGEIADLCHAASRIAEAGYKMRRTGTAFRVSRTSTGIHKCFVECSWELGSVEDLERDVAWFASGILAMLFVWLTVSVNSPGMNVSDRKDLKGVACTDIRLLDALADSHLVELHAGLLSEPLMAAADGKIRTMAALQLRVLDAMTRTPDIKVQFECTCCSGTDDLELAVVCYNGECTAKACKECISGYLGAMQALASPDVGVRCIACNVTYTLQTLAPFPKFHGLVFDAKIREMVLQHEAELRRERDLDPVLRRQRQILAELDDLLLDRCPALACRAPWGDVNGCMALTCTCGTIFCGHCAAVFPTENEAHRHVHVCVHGNGELFVHEAVLPHYLEQRRAVRFESYIIALSQGDRDIHTESIRQKFATFMRDLHIVI
jgi:hypothetical protein